MIENNDADGLFRARRESFGRTRHQNVTRSRMPGDVVHLTRERPEAVEQGERRAIDSIPSSAPLSQQAFLVAGHFHMRRAFFGITG
jgi:hypothetical protein